MKKLTDYTGRELKVGQAVVYPVRKGGDMWLSEMEIVNVRPETNSIGGYVKSGRYTQIQVDRETKDHGKINRVIIINEDFA